MQPHLRGDGGAGAVETAVHVTIGHAGARRQVTFVCRRCGRKALADVVAIGHGSETFLNVAGSAERRARHDAEKEIDRTIARARCPGCKRRPPGALLRFLFPHLLLAAALGAAGLIFGHVQPWFQPDLNERDRQIALWLWPLLAVAIDLLILAPIALVQWRGTGSRVRWLDGGA